MPARHVSSLRVFPYRLKKVAMVVISGEQDDIFELRTGTYPDIGRGNNWIRVEPGNSNNALYRFWRYDSEPFRSWNAKAVSLFI